MHENDVAHKARTEARLLYLEYIEQNWQMLSLAEARGLQADAVASLLDDRLNLKAS